MEYLIAPLQSGADSIYFYVDALFKYLALIW